MTRYRKRGTEVDAFRWDPTYEEYPAWYEELIALGRVRVRGEGEFRQLFLDSPSGKGKPLVANVGDWIVRNARGEVSPMTAEKFEETYEAVPFPGDVIEVVVGSVGQVYVTTRMTREQFDASGIPGPAEAWKSGVRA